MDPFKRQPDGLAAIRAEMAQQHSDALKSISRVDLTAAAVAKAIGETGRVLLLGMGASHAAGRAVEPIYRALGIDALALPLSEQLYNPLPVEGRTVVLTSQSGESAEVLRWLHSNPPAGSVFGLTMEEDSTLARAVPCLVGAGGREKAFAATRSLLVTVAMHAAVLGKLGASMEGVVNALAKPPAIDITAALTVMDKVNTLVTSGRRLQGAAEAIALGLAELSRLPCFSLEGGQLRHGPMEMLGAHVGVVMFRGRDSTADLVARLAGATVEAGSPTIVFDASGESSVLGATTISLPPTADLASLFLVLPVAQEFMVEFAARRVEDVGTPLRSQKVTRIE